MKILKVDLEVELTLTATMMCQLAQTGIAVTVITDCNKIKALTDLMKMMKLYIQSNMNMPKFRNNNQIKCAVNHCEIL